MALLSIAWIAGLGLYFYFTTPLQRENHLLVVWILMLIPVGYWAIKLLLLWLA